MAPIAQSVKPNSLAWHPNPVFHHPTPCLPLQPPLPHATHSGRPGSTTSRSSNSLRTALPWSLLFQAAPCLSLPGMSSRPSLRVKSSDLLQVPVPLSPPPQSPLRPFQSRDRGSLRAVSLCNWVRNMDETWGHSLQLPRGLLGSTLGALLGSTLGQRSLLSGEAVPCSRPPPPRSRAGWGSTEAGMGASSPDRAQAVVLAQLRCRR